ncbi:hypothetical protein L3X38_042001 [Prunus dulcis]|uniref:HAT C-terminal dimerisation domain-containing protein n=1 Tax=Prunus dulcis TaxID=3755 RepID=A0AAD4UW03_PRUDU|nr:hypothetical protein L3X38_042001 [Prunus dulcis]
MKEFDNFESEEFTLLPKRLSYNFASKSAFSVGGRMLDQYRSALNPKNVEALVCTGDWIFGKENCTLAPNLEELTEDIRKMEINATDSAEGSNTITVGGQSRCG